MKRVLFVCEIYLLKLQDAVSLDNFLWENIQFLYLEYFEIDHQFSSFSFVKQLHTGYNGNTMEIRFQSNYRN